jgi:UDP-sugar transporter A1/2/3
MKGPLYASSTAVAIMEILKLISCLGVVTYESGGRTMACLHEDVVSKPYEMLKLSVPSLLYTVQVSF